MIVVSYKTRNSVGKVEVKESVMHSTIALLEKQGAEITNVRKSVQEGLVHISCASDLVMQKICLKQFTNPESMFYITVVSANTPYEFLEKYNPEGYELEDLHFFEECLLIHLKNENEEMYKLYIDELYKANRNGYPVDSEPLWDKINKINK